MSSPTARVAPALLNVLIFYQIRMSEDLQLTEKTWNHTGNQLKGRITSDDQQAYYLQVFQRL